MPQSDFTMRLPRHSVQGVDQAAAWITSQDEDPTWHVSARLVDVSRNGCRLFAACVLTTGDQIRLVMDLPEAERQTDAYAVVRWQQSNPDGVWEYGLEFTSELEWEFLGEMFLNGTLDNR